MLKKATEFIRGELGIEIPAGEVNGTWFAENNIPMVVECTDCGMTMIVFSAYTDDNGQLYCENCAESH